MKSKGFTLIELLVVISIISMLSSVVLVALNATRQKGIIATALTFDQHNYSVYFLDTSAAWDFDGDVGLVARDQSGNGNNLTLSGGATLVTDTPSGYGKALSIPTNDGASAARTTISSLNKPPTDGFTISLWFKFPGNIGTGTFVPIIANASGYPQVSGFNTNGTWAFAAQNGNILYFKYFWTGHKVVIGPTVNMKQWYQATIICDKSINRLTLYVNAVKITPSVDVGVTSNCFFNNTDAIYFGYPRDSGNAVYSVDNIRIYSKALPLSAIEKIYAVESEKFKALAGK